MNIDGKNFIFMDLLDKNYWTIIHILKTIRDRVTKFGVVMNSDGI